MEVPPVFGSTTKTGADWLQRRLRCVARVRRGRTSVPSRHSRTGKRSFRPEWCGPHLHVSWLQRPATWTPACSGQLAQPLPRLQPWIDSLESGKKSELLMVAAVQTPKFSHLSKYCILFERIHLRPNKNPSHKRSRDARTLKGFLRCLGSLDSFLWIQWNRHQ